MRKNAIKRYTAVLMAALLLIAALGVTGASADEQVLAAAQNRAAGAAAGNKSEIVYATLSAGGGVQQVYVVNQFELSQGGGVTDYGDYESLINLTGSEAIAQNGDAVSFQADAGNFYYQGNMGARELPWQVKIAYTLDGREMSAQELAGKSGALEIHITTAQTQGIDPTFYENYMLQISLTLDADKCAGITAPDSTVASAGNNRVIAFTALPETDADVYVKADVTDFEMSGIDITAMPFSMSFEIPDTDEMMEDFDELPDAISELNDGVEELKDGVKELKDGAGKIKSGSSGIQGGLKELSGNGSGILEGSLAIKNALGQMAGTGDSAPQGSMSLGSLMQLPQGLSQMANGLREVSAGLKELKEGFVAAHGALDAAIGGIPGASISQSQIEGLYATADASQHAVLDQLVGYYKAGQTVKGTYENVKGAYAAVEPSITKICGSLDTMASKMDEMASGIKNGLTGTDMGKAMVQLAAGLAELSSNYTAFHGGLEAYIGGVGQLSSNYGKFHSGIRDFSSGVGELYDGVVELHDGTTTLNEEMEKLPDTVREEIDKLTGDYTGKDFEPVSFASPKNSDVALVQFVIKCGDIALPEEENAPVDEAQEQLTPWDRFMALFQ